MKKIVWATAAIAAVYGARRARPYWNYIKDVRWLSPGAFVVDKVVDPYDILPDEDGERDGDADRDADESDESSHTVNLSHGYIPGFPA